MTAPAINSSWERIESWLQANTPRTYASLPPGASREAIQAAETVLGCPLPDELAESLLRHDGSGYFDVIGAFQFQSVQAIVATRQEGTQFEETIQREGRTAGHFLRDGYALWHPSDLPFASDAGGSFLILHIEPHGATSRVGKHDELGTTTFDPLGMWESLNHLLESVATALESHTRLGRHEPTVADGRMTWRFVV
jgi:cell wall assembly regulator SMI1